MTSDQSPSVASNPLVDGDRTTSKALDVRQSNGGSAGPGDWSDVTGTALVTG